MRYLLSILCLLLYTEAYSQHISKEIYYVPAGFTGRISVVFNQQQAPSLLLQDSARIYRIPEDGILLTSDKQLPHATTHAYWFIDSIGNKTAIHIHDSSSQYIPTSTAVVFRIRKDMYPQPSGEPSLHYTESIIVNEERYDEVFHPKADILFQRRIKSRLNRRF